MGRGRHRIGSTLRAVKEIVLMKPPREPFKSRDLVDEVSEIVGFTVSSGTIGQCLTHMRQSGIVERVPVSAESDNWIVVEVILRK